MRKSMEKQEKINAIPELVQERLSGKRLILGGCNGKLREGFVQNLVYIIEQSKADIVLLNGTKKAKAGDYVLLFGETPETVRTGMSKKAADGSKTETGDGYGYEDLFALGEDLQILAKADPGEVLFISDCAVYGKSFGEGYARKEEDLGYVSHTSRAEISVQNLRMAEHLVCRTAREDGLRAKVVRAHGGLYDGEAKAVILAALQVLIYGTCGEIYNLPVRQDEMSGAAFGVSAKKADRNAAEKEVLVWKEARSPLAPMEVVPDTGKFEQLG